MHVTLEGLSELIVLCQLTCPLRTIYGKKGDWTCYGKQSQRGSIQVRPAKTRFESEHIGGCHFEHAKELHRTRVVRCICEAQSGFDSLFASASDVTFPRFDRVPKAEIY